MRRPTACEVPHVPVEAMEINRPGPFLVADKQLDSSGLHGHARQQDVGNEHDLAPIGVLADTDLKPEEDQGQGVFVFPASLEQIRYWTLDQLDGESTASNMAIAVRLEGLVDDRIVERAVEALVERHEALRTTFRLIDGQLSQVIAEQAAYNFTVTDLRGVAADERDAAGEAAVEEHSHARADLAAGPAFFARLIHLTDRQHFLAFTMHHIVCDGWSNGILTRDFADFYAAFALRREPALPELPFQFADFTVWQHNWLASEEAGSALAYWRKHIRREMPAVDLPTDRPRLARKSYPGHIESTLLPAGLASRLKSYCRAHNATMHQVLLAAFEALIARYANQSEFLLGSTIANRTQPGMENVVGRFANPQVILADVKGDPSYQELLRRVIEWSTESYAHQDLPFSRLMEEFQLDQAGASSQFLQVYFVYQKAFMQPHEAAGIKVIPRPSVSGGVNFDLLVSIVERAEGPRLQMEYNTVLFRPERIQNLIAMYVRVLDAVMDDDTQVVSRLPLVAPFPLASRQDAPSQAELSQAGLSQDAPSQVGASLNGLSREEQTQTVAEGAARPQPVLPSLAEWLDRQADRLGSTDAIVPEFLAAAPTATNVISDRKMSWSLLQQSSLALAATLRSHGLAAGQTVALRMEPSTETAVAAWALMRLGAVVLPLPFSASAVEWTRILARYKPVLALASSSFAAQLNGIQGLDDLYPAAAPASPKPSAPNPYPDPSSPAWLAVGNAVSDAVANPGNDSPSGTGNGTLTGHPFTQEALLRRMLSTAGELDLRSGETVLITAAQSAVDAWVDLMLPLAAGATIIYANSPASEASSAASLTSPNLALSTSLDRHQASFLFTSASDLLQAIHERWPGDRRLNVVVRGNLLTEALVRRISTTPLRLWSLVSSAQVGGPVAVARVTAMEQPSFQALAAGKFGERLSVLDDNGHPAPSGVSGELAICVGQTVTRTGHLARFLTQLTAGVAGDSHQDSHPSIEILDRSERLIRLHGYRLRLSELEDVLWQNPAITEVVGAVRPVGDTDTLVAYYRPLARSVGGAESTVREHFHLIAPGLVAGAELIAVDAIPRHADGSADLALLPMPGQAAASSSDEYVPARDELESSLVAIWEDVLGVRPIGIRTQFFKLGGYSLMIVRLFARINKVLGTSLPITTIFNAPTVEQLADIVRGRAYYSSLVPVRTTGRQTPFFMIHSYLLYSGIPAVLGEDVPFYGLRELDTDAENMTVERRAASYLDAIRSVQPHGPYFIGGWCAAGPLAVETARQITASGEEVGFLVLFDSWRPGYSAELAREQAGTKEMALRARLGRKYRFHRNRWRMLSTNQKFLYIAAAVGNKFASVRNRLYLKNWAMAELLCRKFGLQLPHFMHNVSLTTLNSLSEYRGVEPYAGGLTLMRAKEAPYFPGAQEHCGWNSIVKGGVEVLWAPGDHESMFLEPHLQTVGELLRQSIAGAQRAKQPELHNQP